MFKSLILLLIVVGMMFAIGFGGLFYILIKKAVKNGVLEALEEYNTKDDCEE